MTGDVGAFDVGSHLDQSSRVQATVDYCGMTDFLQMDSHALPNSTARASLHSTIRRVGSVGLFGDIWGGYKVAGADLTPSGSLSEPFFFRVSKPCEGIDLNRHFIPTGYFFFYEVLGISQVPGGYRRLDLMKSLGVGGGALPPSHDAATSGVSLLMGAPIQTIPDRVRQANPITYVTPAQGRVRWSPSVDSPHGGGL